MGIVARVVCYAYWILLTMLLLVPSPATWVGLQEVPTFPWGKFGVHLIAFTMLAILVHATRWPKRPWWPLLVLLVLYGITTETLQLFVPTRTARVMDAVENILGIAAGSGIYWLVLWLVRPGMKVNLPAELVKCAIERDTVAE
jgi:glycopeptide antibiotics resistance protein